VCWKLNNVKPGRLLLKGQLSKPMTTLFYQQSAVIPYRVNNGNLQVLLITSASGKRWVIPKGIIEPDMSSAASAAQEAWEEAGLKGEVIEPAVGRYVYFKWGGECHVEVFLMFVSEVFDSWPEAGVRSREWLNIKDAANRVNENPLKQMIRKLRELIG
jgi:8-oxo-dGTP pyrophosphatase MutT (NUDIX family)